MRLFKVAMAAGLLWGLGGGMRVVAQDSAVTAAEGRKTLLPPAASISSLLTPPGMPSFASPQVGPVVECDGVERQFVLLNPTIVQGEPVIFRLFLRSQRPTGKVEFKARMVFGADLNITVFPPNGGRPYDYMGLQLGTVTPNSVLEFDGFRDFRYDIRMASDENSVTGAAFDMPGEHRLSVMLVCRPMSGEPAPMNHGVFTLNVKPATGDDAKALQVLSEDYKIYEFLHLRGAGVRGTSRFLTKRQGETLERVVNEARTAAVRPSAMIVLADFYTSEGEHDKALAMYDQVIKDYPQSTFSDEARFAGAYLALARKDRNVAMDRFEELWQDPRIAGLIQSGNVFYNNFVKWRLPPTPGTQWMIQQQPGADPTFDTGQAQGPRIEFDPGVLESLGMSADEARKIFRIETDPNAMPR